MRGSVLRNRRRRTREGAEGTRRRGANQKEGDCWPFKWAHRQTTVRLSKGHGGVRLFRFCAILKMVFVTASDSPVDPIPRRH